MTATTLPVNVNSPAPRADRGRIALVLWSAAVGGVETLVVALADRMRLLGASPEVVIIGGDGPLVERLEASGAPYHMLGFARGRDVLRHPRRYAEAVIRSGPDGALVGECGFIGAALRAGGYDRPIVAVEHGAILRQRALLRRTLNPIGRVAGAWADDAEVAVSEFVLSRMHGGPHARRLRLVYNGVAPVDCDGSAEQGRQRGGGGGDLTVGFVGRLIPGKGLDVLIRAVAAARDRARITLLIAGDGRERARLSALAHELGADGGVNLLGLVDDVQEFWRRCDVAVMPSTVAESFGMAALEAMACGRPVIASRIAALPEVVSDGVTGMLVTPGDVDGLTDAMVSYAQQPGLRLEHAAAARARSLERFSLDECARAYLDVFTTIRR